MNVQANRSSEYRTGTTPVAVEGFPDGADLFSERSAGADRWVSDNQGFYRARGKRVFDILVASAMLIAFAPLMLLLTALASIGGGKPFFAHPRVRQHGDVFGCLKFRSMRIGAPEMLAEILAADPVAAAEWEADRKLTNDPRVTRIGAFLRKSSLDELPQLICVLRGEMSLVGPRPVTEDELFRYGPARSAYATDLPDPPICRCVRGSPVSGRSWDAMTCPIRTVSRWMFSTRARSPSAVTSRSCF